MSLSTDIEILVTGRGSNRDVDLGLHVAFAPDASACKRTLLTSTCRTQSQDTSQEQHHLLEKQRMTMPAACLELLVCRHLTPEIKATPECSYKYQIMLAAASDVTLQKLGPTSKVLTAISSWSSVAPKCSAGTSRWPCSALESWKEIYRS